MRIVLVGPCAAGKSTLAAALTADGHAVRVCAQEHSEIRHLWALSEPDVVIYLAVSLPGIRRRRDEPTWPARIYATQLRRLEQALASCDIYIDTSHRDRASVLAVARRGIAARVG
jgi:hypothetical protein